MTVKPQDENQASWKQITSSSATSLVAGGAVLAIQGASIASPIGIGIAVISGVNALSTGLVTKLFGGEESFKTEFFKLCATVTVLALSALSLPYAAVALGSHAFFNLSLQLALTIGIADVVTKVATLTTYKMGSWIIGSFGFPKTEEGIRKLSKEQLLKSKEAFEKTTTKFTALPLSSQVAFNQMLVEKGDEKALPLTFTEVGTKWTPESLGFLSNIDHTNFTVEQQKEINTLLFSNNLLPQERDYNSSTLPEIDPAASFSKEQAHWARVHFATTKTTVPGEVAVQLHKYQLPPVGHEAFALKTPENIKDLSSSDVKWYYNAFVASPEKWNALTFAQQKAFVNKFGQESLRILALPKRSIVALNGAMANNIPWKKVGAVALILLTLTGIGLPIAAFAMRGQSGLDNRQCSNLNYYQRRIGKDDGLCRNPQNEPLFKGPALENAQCAAELSKLICNPAPVFPPAKKINSELNEVCTPDQAPAGVCTPDQAPGFCTPEQDPNGMAHIMRKKPSQPQPKLNEVCTPDQAPKNGTANLENFEWENPSQPQSELNEVCTLDQTPGFCTSDQDPNRMAQVMKFKWEKPSQPQPQPPVPTPPVPTPPVPTPPVPTPPVNPPTSSGALVSWNDWAFGWARAIFRSFTWAWEYFTLPNRN